MGSSSVGTATTPAKEQQGLSNILESTQVMEKQLGKAFLLRAGERMWSARPSISDCSQIKINVKFGSGGNYSIFFFFFTKL
jgi:hypothetical protein